MPKHRPKRKFDPNATIDFDQARHSPALAGMDSMVGMFLNPDGLHQTPPAVIAPPDVLAAPALTTPPAMAPSPAVPSAPDVIPAPDETASPDATASHDVIAAPAVTSAPDESAPPAVMSSPAVTSPADVATPYARKPKARKAAAPINTSPPAVSLKRPIHRCTLAQHGHSSNDQLVYQAMWAAGRPERRDKPNGNRIVAIGVAKLAKLLGTIHERNVTVIIRRLISKQSIEILRREVSDQSAAREYKVYCYDEILERRRRLGLEWITRSSRGVDFVNPQTGQLINLQTAGGAAISSTAISSLGAVTSPAAVAAGGTPVVTSPAPPAATYSEPPAVTSAPLENIEGNRVERTTTTELREAIQSLMPMFDDHAVDRVWSKCQAQCSDVTPDEVAQLFEMKWVSFRRNRTITNLAGALIDAVPKSCTRAALELLRQGREDSASNSAEYTREQLEEMLRSGIPSLREIAEAELAKK